jgi:hypothetical protein
MGPFSLGASMFLPELLLKLAVLQARLRRDVDVG